MAKQWEYDMWQTMIGKHTSSNHMPMFFEVLGMSVCQAKKMGWYFPWIGICTSHTLLFALCSLFIGKRHVGATDESCVWWRAVDFHVTTILIIIVTLTIIITIIITLEVLIDKWKSKIGIYHRGIRATTEHVSVFAGWRGEGE